MTNHKKYIPFKSYIIPKWSNPIKLLEVTLDPSPILSPHLDNICFKLCIQVFVMRQLCLSADNNVIKCFKVICLMLHYGAVFIRRQQFPSLMLHKILLFAEKSSSIRFTCLYILVHKNLQNINSFIIHQYNTRHAGDLVRFS